MVTQELVDKITLKIQAGHPTEHIKESLMDEGYDEADIDIAISEIQKAALLQIPVYKYFDSLFKSWDEKTATWPVHKSLIAIGGIALILIIIVGVFYFTADPLGTKFMNADAKREENFKALTAAVNKYYLDNLVYPSDLNILVPKYIASIPQEKKSNVYSYKILEDKFNYELCVTYEARNPDCATSYVSSIPVVLPSVEEMPFKITGRVFEDTNRNGKFEGEGVFGGARINVMGEGGKNYCELKTDDQGYFECGVDKEGSYTVSLVLSSDYLTTVKNPQQVIVSAANPPQELHIGVIHK